MRKTDVPRDRREALLACCRKGYHLDELVSADAGGVFAEVVDALVAAGVLQPSARDAVRAAFQEREARGTTAFGHGIAMPHVFHPDLAEIHVLVARHATGIDMGALDGETTHTLICVAGPETQRETYLALLAHVAQVIRDRTWRRFIAQSAPAGILEILAEAGEA
jgi:mannitol/fructose-specific phosphotransferase system IIA component (Ntr-type)